MALVVSSEKGFRTVESAKITILQGNDVLQTVMLAKAGSFNAVLAGIFYRKNPEWAFI